MKTVTIGTASKRLLVVRQTVSLGERQRTMDFMRTSLENQATRFTIEEAQDLLSNHLSQLLEIFGDTLTIYLDAEEVVD